MLVSYTTFARTSGLVGEGGYCVPVASGFSRFTDGGILSTFCIVLVWFALRLFAGLHKTRG